MHADDQRSILARTLKELTLGALGKTQDYSVKTYEELPEARYDVVVDRPVRGTTSSIGIDYFPELEKIVIIPEGSPRYEIPEQLLGNLQKRFPNARLSRRGMNASLSGITESQFYKSRTRRARER